MVAMAHEDLAYATYVHEYNSGYFKYARQHAEKALDILKKLLPDNHLLLASTKRVLALILEEIAIDEPVKSESLRMLKRSESLHLSALELAINAFGEVNVQTSKHYGNLGRLYQSMEKYDKAEKMHLKAIEIKECLLGREDYEVALSIGHLASLYNYDLNEFSKAEVLYLRSIDIGVKLFGPSYSGLEYDYRGLIRIYHETQDWNKFFDFTYKLRNWKELRDQKNEVGEDESALVMGCPQPITSVISSVLSCASSSSSGESGDSGVSSAASTEGDSSSSGMSTGGDPSLASSSSSVGDDDEEEDDDMDEDKSGGGRHKSE